MCNRLSLTFDVSDIKLSSNSAAVLSIITFQLFCCLKGRAADFCCVCVCTYIKVGEIPFVTTQ